MLHLSIFQQTHKHMFDRTAASITVLSCIRDKPTSTSARDPVLRRKATMTARRTLRRHGDSLQFFETLMRRHVLTCDIVHYPIAGSNKGTPPLSPIQTAQYPTARQATQRRSRYQKLQNRPQHPRPSAHSISVQPQQGTKLQQSDVSTKCHAARQTTAAMVFSHICIAPAKRPKHLSLSRNSNRGRIFSPQSSAKPVRSQSTRNALNCVRSKDSNEST